MTIARCNRIITIALVLAAAWLAGCRAPATTQGQAQLARAQEQFDQAQYAGAIQTLSSFLDREADRREADEAYYFRGLSYMQMNPPQDRLAEADFRQSIEIAQDPRLRGLAYVGLGHIYYETRPDQLAAAIDHYEKALKGLGSGSPRDVVLFRLGSALQKLGRWTQADLYFSQCFEQFPQSQFAAYARDAFGAQTWRLQFGAFSTMDRANTMIAKVRQSGLQGQVTPLRQDSSVLYAVQAGSYQSYATALDARQRVVTSFPEVAVVPAGGKP